MMAIGTTAMVATKQTQPNWNPRPFQLGVKEFIVYNQLNTKTTNFCFGYFILRSSQFNSVFLN